MTFLFLFLFFVFNVDVSLCERGVRQIGYDKRRDISEREMVKARTT
jgi:hypothetical protein